jgi:hypothetical protein
VSVRRLTVLLVLLLVAGCTQSGHQEWFYPANSNEKPIRLNDARGNFEGRFPAYLNGKFGWVASFSVEDPQGLWSGKVSLKSGRGGPAWATRSLRAFGRAKVLGRMTANFVSQQSDQITLDAMGLVSSKAGGTLCVSFKGQSLASYADQVFYGTFKVVGGSGRYGRLRGSGTFLSIQPSPRPLSSSGVKLHLEGGFKHVSEARHTGLSKACKDSTKPFPAPSGPVSVSLTGLAFASAGSSGTLPAGTTVYPSGATVTGSAGCGQALYAVFSYSGAGSAAVTGQTNATSGASYKISDTISQSKTAILALPAPAATDHVDIGVLATTPDRVDHNYSASLDLSRSCSP